MRGAESLAPASLALALAIAAVAVGLGIHLGWERSHRDPDLSESDRRHFLSQDLRRILGVGLLSLLALGIYVGSRVPELIPVENPGRGGLTVRPNSLFLAVWLGVFASLVGTVAVALSDWSATRKYARRHRREMDQTRSNLVREVLNYRGHDDPGGSNGRPLDPL